MNVAVGGSWGGKEGVDADAFEGDGQVLEIDWVRVHQFWFIRYYFKGEKENPASTVDHFWVLQN